MSFPDKCIKGIPNESFLTPEGHVASHLFEFKTNPIRGDEILENSINWEDNDDVVEFTMNQTKSDGSLLSYERQPIEENIYHGNILLRPGTSKPTMRQIAAGLALAASEIIKGHS